MKSKLPWAQTIEPCPLNDPASKLKLLTVAPGKDMTRLGKRKDMICSSADLNDILQSCYPLRAKSNPAFLAESKDTIGTLIRGILAFCVNGCKTRLVQGSVCRNMFNGSERYRRTGRGTQSGKHNTKKMDCHSSH